MAPRSKSPGKRRSANPKRPYAERLGKLMTVPEVADELGVTERQVQRLIARGELKAVKVGGLVRVHVDDLAAYIASLREPGE